LNKTPKSRFSSTTASVQHLLERIRLRDVARKAVQNEALGRVRSCQSLADHPEHGVIVDQLSAIHRGLRAKPEWSPRRHRLAQQIARGNLRHAVGLDEQLRLRALAGPGRA
jgi:hypothetical protein